MCYDIANGDVYVELMNEGTKDTRLTVKPCAYRHDAPLQLTIKRDKLLSNIGRWLMLGIGMILKLRARVIRIITDVLLAESKQVRIPLVILQ